MCNVLGLMAEKFRDYTTAMEVYMHCLADTNKEAIMHKSTNSDTTGSTKLLFFTELKGELMLRIALLKKEMGAVDQALQMCTKISTEPFGQALKANALCLKVY